MPHYKRIGLEISDNSSNEIINPNMKILLQININMYRGQERGKALSVYSHP